jgi:hypothetical protein
MHPPWKSLFNRPYKDILAVKNSIFLSIECHGFLEDFFEQKTIGELPTTNFHFKKLRIMYKKGVVQPFK